MKCISVIVPVYNGAKRIEKCINSIWKQTYPCLEVIVIDDGSQDNSSEVVQHLICNWTQEGRSIRLITKENEGVSVTRNKGIAMATGDYVTFVDQDDILEKEYLAEYMACVQEDAYDIVIGGYQRVTDEGKVTRRVQLSEGEWSKFVVSAPWAHIYRRVFLVQHDLCFLSTGIGEDVYFNLMAYACTRQVKIIDSVKYLWIYNPESVSNTSQKQVSKVSDPMLLLGRLMEDLPRENCIDSKYLEYYFVRYVVWYFLFTVRKSNKAEFKERYHELTCWLKEHFPEYAHNPYISIWKLKEDIWSVRVAVWLWNILEIMGFGCGLMSLLAREEKGDRDE